MRRKRTGVVLQLAVADCAAACLTMVARAHGLRTTLHACREACGTGRDGATAREIVSGAAQVGLYARVFAADLAALTRCPLPAIVSWHPHHFVVLERLTAGQVRLVDPAVGRRQLSLDAFTAGYTGIVFTFARSHESVEPRAAAARPHAIRAALRGSRRLLAFILLTSLLTHLIGLSVPVATGWLVEAVARPGGPPPSLLLIGGGFAALAAFQALVGWVRAIALAALQRGLDGRLVTGFFTHLMSLPLSFFTQRTGADLTERAAGTALIRELVAGPAVLGVLDAAFLLGYVILLALTDPWTALIVVCLALIQAAGITITTKRSHVLLQEYLTGQASAQAQMLECIRGIAAVKGMGLEGQALRGWSRDFTRSLAAMQRQARLTGVTAALQMAVHLLSTLGLLWFGTHRVITGELTLGRMLMLNGLAVMALAPVSSLVAHGMRLQQMGAHLLRIRDILEEPPEEPQGKPSTACLPAAPPPAPLKGGIELHNVSFCHHPRAPFALRDVSLVIHPGQKVAVVGPSGSGKTTLGMLLLGLYQPTEGQVSYDGLPADTWTPAQLRQRFGIVPQEVALFSGSIRGNIALDETSLPASEIVAAARTAAVHDEITVLPLGYDTVLVEGGGGLSGGQRQRIAIARAVARRPAVFLLDEATSQLDTATERIVNRNLASLPATTVFITHRITAVRDADLILVLDRGRLVEQGTHTDLIGRGGTYAALTAAANGETRPRTAPKGPG